MLSARGLWFFKQKTAYEMRISDWSSDVCSSDLGRLGMTLAAFHLKKKNVLTADPSNPGYQQTAGEARSQGFDLQFSGQLTEQLRLIGEIGRASCRERVCRDV